MNRINLDTRGRVKGLRKTFGVLVRNLMTVWMVYWVNVSENFGASSHGLSGIKGSWTIVVAFQY